MPYEWIILVLVIGGRDYTTPSKAKIYLVYKRYPLQRHVIFSEILTFPMGSMGLMYLPTFS